MKPQKFLLILLLLSFTCLHAQDLVHSEYVVKNCINIKWDKVDYPSNKSIMFLSKPNHLSHDKTSHESIHPLMVNSRFQEKKSPVFKSTLIGAGAGCMVGIIFGLMVCETERWEYPILGDPHKVQISTGENVMGGAEVGLGFGAGFGYLIGKMEEREMDF